MWDGPFEGQQFRLSSGIALIKELFLNGFTCQILLLVLFFPLFFQVPMLHVKKSLAGGVFDFSEVYLMHTLSLRFES